MIWDINPRILLESKDFWAKVSLLQCTYKSISQWIPSCVLESTFLKVKGTVQGAFTRQGILERRTKETKTTMRNVWFSFFYYYFQMICKTHWKIHLIQLWLCRQPGWKRIAAHTMPLKWRVIHGLSPTHLEGSHSGNNYIYDSTRILSY